MGKASKQKEYLESLVPGERCYSKINLAPDRRNQALVREPNRAVHRPNSQQRRYPHDQELLPIPERDHLGQAVQRQNQQDSRLLLLTFQNPPQQHYNHQLNQRANQGDEEVRDRSIRQLEIRDTLGDQEELRVQFR